MEGGPEGDGDISFWLLGDGGDEVEFETVTDAGGDLEDGLGSGGELADLMAHQFDDVIGDGLGLDGGGVPVPTAVITVKKEEFILVEAGEKSADEEGVAVCFLVDEFGQIGEVAEGEMEGIG